MNQPILATGGSGTPPAGTGFPPIDAGRVADRLAEQVGHRTPAEPEATTAEGRT